MVTEVCNISGPPTAFTEQAAWLTGETLGVRLTSGSAMALLVAANSVDTCAAVTLALCLGEGYAGDQAFINLCTCLLVGALVHDLKEAVSTLTGVANKSVDTSRAAQGGVETGGK